MDWLILLALTASAGFILALKAGDPKSLRAAGFRREGHGKSQRRLLAAGAILPGAAFLAIGNAAAFLMWLGACAVIGCIIVAAFAPR